MNPSDNLPIQPKTQSKKIKIISWSVVALASLALIFLVSFNQTDLSSNVKGFETATNNFLVQTLHTNTLTPPPLRGVFGGSNSPLTESGVLTWTNKNRADADLLPLALNPTLSGMAETKLQDLFAKQYFEHVSPTGVGPSGLAQNVGYDYIVIGENLALGNFDGDKALLDAWMASPGHRANILNVRYKEIGIAVGQGTFEGKSTWIAVQEFGLPITACPVPSSSEKVSIDSIKKSVDATEVSITTQKTAIDAMTIKSGSDYNQKITAYNTLVHKYNALVVTLKAKISDYNKQVVIFNTCADLATTTQKL